MALDAVHSKKQNVVVDCAYYGPLGLQCNYYANVSVRPLALSEHVNNS